VAQFSLKSLPEERKIPAGSGGAIRAVKFPSRRHQQLMTDPQTFCDSVCNWIVALYRIEDSDYPRWFPCAILLPKSAAIGYY
jgi:hypothetical protein